MQDNKHTDIRKRHTKRQLKRRRQQLIRRYTFFGTLGAIALFIILFITPIFSVRTINIEGNEKVSAEEYLAALEELRGDNLFLTSSKDAKKALTAFAYVEDVTVDRKIFPPSVTVIIEECKPSFYLSYNNTYIVIDKTAKVLEHTAEQPSGTELVGLNPVSSIIGEKLALDDSAKLEDIISILASFDKSDLLDGITKINLENLSAIDFNYENRLDAQCGPYVDFSRKLGIFREAVNSNSFTENTRGTIDLTKSGYAYYTP